MWPRIITLLVALAEIARQIVRLVERRRVEEKAESNEEDLRKIEQDPAEWFEERFGAGATVVVQTCKPCDAAHDVGVREDDELPAEGPAAEADARDPPV